MPQLCRFYSETGKCKKGNECDYAHDDGTTNGGHNHQNGRGRGGGGGGSSGRGGRAGGRSNNKSRRPAKNTESFEPSHAAPDMRIIVATAKGGKKKYNREYVGNDVILVPDLWDEDDMSIYDTLLSEMESCGVKESNLWKSWHGDSHLIADDKSGWKKNCPTFNGVITKLEEYFGMNVKATRFNFYRDSSEWKPFHHDAAAVKPDKAKTQNITVAVSFGSEREAAFEHAKHRTVLSVPSPNGSCYVFNKDVNIEWRHGILQIPPEYAHQEGRISIIVWGWVDMVDKY
eukprot:TRINITY_DN5845_c0_g2_i1.p1 TRINITY_DN5845_c0_g2~~TRINITY_DN5845_c0_g2_i1.p1  ORF type:complete len:298 (+),score=62.47 TRINITY_DN5845_c0_g2_i1:34-894(+)